MTVIKKAVKLPYNVEEMKKVIMDIEKYSEYLEWCKQAKVHGQTPYKITASIHGVKMGIGFAFTLIYMIRSPVMIEIQILPQGPFRHLLGFWKFEPIEGAGSRLYFELQYEFKNAFMGWTLSPLIKNEINTVIKAFCVRAKKLYNR